LDSRFWGMWIQCVVKDDSFVRFQVLTAASMIFRAVFWVILPCKMIVDRRFRGAYCLHHPPWVGHTTLIIRHGLVTRLKSWLISHTTTILLTDQETISETINTFLLPSSYNVLRM
jgi:hypothetical protein